MTAAPEPIYFADAVALRDWLERHHQTATELIVGFHKVATGNAGLRWAEAVDEALCVGWIDGVRRRVDDDRYVIRFTPRTPTSTWSRVNIRRVGELDAEGRLRPAGRAAFETRKQQDDGAYSHEVAPELGEAFEAVFRACPAAWLHFQQQPVSYRRAATWWVVSAKRDDTRQRRLAQLIDISTRAERLPHLDRRGPRGRGTG